MIILHASWLNGALHLWAERRPDGTAAPTKRRGKPKAPTRALSPHDAGQDGLCTALTDISGLDAPDIEGFCRAEAWLPTTKGSPVASSPLIAEPPDAEGQSVQVCLAPWVMTTVPLAWSQTKSLLAKCLEGELLAKGVLAGKDLPWWAEALRLSAALVGRGGYLPDVVRDGGRHLARWRPMPDPASSDRLATLAETMPGAVRCLGEIDGVAPPATAPKAILDAFVAWTVDMIVRGACEDGETSKALSGHHELDRSKGAKGAEGIAGRVAFPSLHDAWLHALRSVDPVIPWSDARELDALAESLHAWRKPVAVARQSRIRLCFRLEEPVAQSGREDETGNECAWRVRYLVQPLDDRSLIIDVGEAWKPQSRAAVAIRKTSGMAQAQLSEYLLTSLGQAARLCPAVAESLQGQHPGGYTLSTGQAHAFLNHDAPLLEASGFGLILPAWWTGQGTKKRLTLRAHAKSPTMQAAAGLGLSVVASIDWRLALGDEVLSEDELRRLARLKQPLVNLRGEWVELDAAQLKAAADFVRGRRKSALTAAEVVRLGLGAEDAEAGLPVTGVTADGWIAEMLQRLRNPGSMIQVAPPAGFAGSLRPYQARGLSWLAFLRGWGLGACLADDMGLGKTVQTLALVAREREAGETRPVLLVCPTSLTSNWLKEAGRFTPDLPVLVHHGAGRRKREGFLKEAAAQGLVIASYGLLQRDLDFLREVDWAGVILDEAQNVKNPESKQSKAARALRADYRVALTGTPVENHVGDLWAIMDFLNPGLLGSQRGFKARFHAPIHKQNDPEASARLKEIVVPFILRRLKTDRAVISDLPEKQEMKTYCTLTREQASLYAAVLKEAEPEIAGTEGIRRKGLILSVLARLKQVCNHPAQFLGDRSAAEGRSGKLSRLTEMLEEVLAAGERALVFTQFAEMGEILKGHLEETLGREVLFLHGRVPKAKRDRMVERFQAPGDGPPLFILSLKAGGTGLNLTRANHVFHYDRWWNPAVENQATDRAFRIGQTRNVQVHKFICAGTLEERIDEMIERKTSVTASVVSAGESWLTELSIHDLRRVLALGPNAIGD